MTVIDTCHALGCRPTRSNTGPPPDPGLMITGGGYQGKTTDKLVRSTKGGIGLERRANLLIMVRSRLPANAL